MGMFRSGLPTRLIAAFCALFLLVVTAPPSVLPGGPGPVSGTQGVPDIDMALTAQPLIIAPVSMEGDADARKLPHRSVAPVLSRMRAPVFHAARPPGMRATAFRARAPPLPA